MSKISELKQKRAAAYEKMKVLNATAAAEKRNLNSDEQTQWEGWNSEMVDLKKQIDIEERNAQLAKEFGTGEFQAGNHQQDPKPEMRYEDIFDHALRRGEAKLTPEQNQWLREQRAATDPMTTLVDAEGGFAVPEEFSNQLIKTMKAYGSIMGHVSGFNTSTGAPLHFTIGDDTNNVGRIIGETQAVVKKNTTLARKTINSYKYTSDEIPISFELLRDSMFNLQAWIIEIMGERIGRAVANHIISGTGVGQPEGLLTAAPLGTTAAAATALTRQDLIKIEHTVDPAYRNQNCRFVFNDKTLEAIKLLDIGSTDSRPLYAPSTREGEQDRIHGFAYSICQEMPDIATGATPILFGDLSKYRLRSIGSPRMKRLDELGARTDEILFMGFASYDGKLLVPNAVKKLQMG